MTNNINAGKALSNINIKSVARYAMMPGIIPRIRALSFHFGHFAYLIALVFQSANLLPAGHPALNPAHIGRFSVRQVIAIAANNLHWSWRNTDQIAIFSAVIIGLILTVIQAFIIAAMALVDTAHAQQPAVESFFTTPTENVPTDVVLIFLDQVFGSNLEIFGSASQPLGTAVFLGLQQVLGIYSMATMVIAVIVVLYYIITVVGEAAKTGTPFGQRFNSLWAPIRLIVALGLLVPLGSGLNSAQYITLWTAKMGSGLGTQIWSNFAGTFTDAKDIVSKPASASTTGLVSRIFLSEVCAAAFNQIEQGSNKEVKILQALQTTSQDPVFNNPQAMVDAAKHAGMRHVDLSWSARQSGENATDYTCGHITISLADFDLYKDGNLVDASERSGTGFWNWVFGGHDLADKMGEVHSNIRTAYIAEIKAISDAVKPAAKAIAEYHISANPTGGLGKEETVTAAGVPAILKSAAEGTHKAVNLAIETSYKTLTQSSFAKSSAYDEMIKRGWGAAGLWYGNIGKINQKYMEVVNAAAPTLGTIFSSPQIEDPGQDKTVGFFDYIFGASRMGASDQAELEAALIYANTRFAQHIASGAGPDSPLYADARLQSAHTSSESAFASALLWMLGGGDLYDMKNDPNLDPMARLMGAGHSIVNRSLLSFGVGGALGLGGAVAGSLPSKKAKFIGELAGAAATLFFTIAAIGLVAGIFLAYVVPILPFIYFAFAVIGWVLEIFEAVIAMPLWALAHLRIDGDGLPGQAAIGGYQLLLMILLRPALIIFGLIGGYVIFGAAMFFLGTVYNSATSIVQQDISGSSVGALGVFVYTIIFAFLAYNIATMCFKMIDDVPKGILRWLGSGTPTFGDSRGDPIGGSREMVVGAVAGATAVSSGLKGTSQGMQKANQRRQMRNQGMDPDNPVQRVEIVSGGGTSPGGSGGPSGHPMRDITPPKPSDPASGSGATTRPKEKPEDASRSDRPRDDDPD